MWSTITCCSTMFLNCTDSRLKGYPFFIFTATVAVHYLKSSQDKVIRALIIIGSWPNFDIFSFIQKILHTCFNIESQVHGDTSLPLIFSMKIILIYLKNRFHFGSSPPPPWKRPSFPKAFIEFCSNKPNQLIISIPVNS